MNTLRHCAARDPRWIAILPAAALACNFLTAGAATPTVTAQPSPTAPATPTEAPTLVPSPTPAPTEATPTPLLAVTVTPPQTPTAARNCRDDAAFVKDITVPDATEFDAGAPFTKTWRVENTGTCPWTGEYSLAFVGGDQLGGPPSVPILGEVPPGGVLQPVGQSLRSRDLRHLLRTMASVQRPDGAVRNEQRPPHGCHHREIIAMVREKR